MPELTGKKLRVGVLGVGTFAEVCHIPGINSHPEAEVVAIYGRDLDRARELAEKFKIAHIFSDFHELLDRSDIDAICIATRPVDHVKQAVDAFNHNKHVFCEKPMARELNEAKQMLHVATQSGKIHQIGFTFRYGYAVQELKKMVGQGAIGEPYYLRVHYNGWEGLRPDSKASWRDSIQLAGGGILYDLGSHLFDIAQYILGPIEYVTGFHKNLPRKKPDPQTGELIPVETSDMAGAWFRFSNGARGEWFISQITPPEKEKGRLEVIGPKGALQASLSRGSIDVLRISTPSQPQWRDLPLPPAADDGAPHNLGLMMRNFVNACLQGQLAKGIDASFHDGFVAQEALHAIEVANEQLSWVRLPLKLSNEQEPERGNDG